MAATSRRWWTSGWVMIPVTITAAVALFGVLIATVTPDATISANTDKAPSRRTPVNAASPARTQSPLPRPTARATPTAATVPAVRGLSINQATHELQRAGLKVGHVSRKPSPARPGTLLSQGVTRGAKLKPGSPVSLIIAIPLPKIPAVVGQTASSATAELRRAGFKVVKRQRTLSAGHEGVVLAQLPEGGVRTRPASVVTVVVAHVIPKAAPTKAPSCTSGYSPCLRPAPDYDCAGGSGDGPGYAYGPIRITGSDPYDLDRDGDGVACED